MEELLLKSNIQVAQMDELSDLENNLIEMAIEASSHAYAIYSHFLVGAAVYLENGETIIGCNQENVSFSAGICAERTAIYAAGAKYPDIPIKILAIAARKPDGKLQEKPISPCGICRQVILEAELRYQQPIRILLYGTNEIYIISSVKDLLPLSFSDF